MKWYPIAGEKCLGQNELGPYESLTCLYPFLKYIQTPYELQFSAVQGWKWMEDHAYVPFVAVILYGCAILYGQHYFKSRPAWNLRNQLALWNLCLAIFSFIGFIRSTPQQIHDTMNYPLREFYCMDGKHRYEAQGVGLFGLLFVFSKFPELLDTFFIIVHKKPLIFLHWYHHITVLLYSWFSYGSRSPVCIIFCTMNYAVHALMYLYYFLMAMNMKPKAFNAMYITLAQISQMVVGVTVTLIGAYFLYFDKEVMATKGTENPCALEKNQIWAGFLMYGSYLALFLNFFVSRFLRNKRIIAYRTDTKHSRYPKGSLKGKVL